MGTLTRRMLGIPPSETSFARRGFRGGSAEARRRFERIGEAFVLGYHEALEVEAPERPLRGLEIVERELSGFAFEGAAMGFRLLDTLKPWRRNRWQAFVDGPGRHHAYMVHVGAGWALARLGGNPERFLRHLSPTLRWLVVDGMGFHEGYFHWPRAVVKRSVPGRLRGYARRAFDQGLGRSLWFVEGAEPARIATTISTFDAMRQADLWSGVGLACAYAGGADRTAIEALVAAAGGDRLWLAQGAAFAAQARERAANPAPHTELACRTLCGLDAARAAALTEEALAGLAEERSTPVYEVWRLRLHSGFEPRAAVRVHG